MTPLEPPERGEWAPPSEPPVRAEPLDSGSDELERLRGELERAHAEVMELRLDLQRESVSRRVLSRELGAYTSSRAHRATSRVVRGIRRATSRGAHAIAMTERPPHPLFDETFYLTSNPDVLAAGVDAWEHYDQDGWQQGRNPNPLFDSDWYRVTYRDQLKPGENPLVDYWRKGWKEGRNPSQWFDTAWYLLVYPDVKQSGINPLVHFLSTGAQEGRKPTYLFSPRHYISSMAARTPVRRESAVADFLRRRDPAFLGECKSQQRSQRQTELQAFLDGRKGLDLRSHDAAVTVVVVVWNQAAFTLACLESIARSSVPADVLVVDNASSDETLQLLPRMEGIRVIRNEENRGFVGAVNQALAEVRTPLTVLLNNDATMAPEALERACVALTDPNVGAVGGRVILPNGLLQEAGSYLDSQSIAHGYLRNEPPWSGNAMYRRPVDFCSGVFLGFRTDVFRSLGGLDTAFAPAYGEEVDLCLRMWSNGLQVIYDPSIEIHHLEFGSSGDSSEPGRLMERNRALLATKHGRELADREGPGGAADRMAQARIAGPRILVIEDRIPHEFEGAGFPRTASIVRSLRALGCFVTLLPMYSGEAVDWEGAWQELGSEVRILPEVEVEGVAKYLQGNVHEFDVVWICRSHNMARLEPVLRDLHGDPGRPKIVYDSECISALRDAKVPYLNPADALVHVGPAIRQELACARHADLFVAVSTHEESVARLALPGVATCVIGQGIEPSEVPVASPEETRANILFVGRLTEPDSPNVDGLNWFIREVMPRLDEDLRRHVRVAGAVDKGVLEPTTEAWILGPVGDLHEQYATARLLLAPQRFAAGVPLKVIHAAAAGVPVVATPLIAAQLGWEAGREIAVAVTPEQFAREIRTLFDDDEKWREIRDGAMAQARLRYSPTVLRESVAGAMAHLGLES